MTRTPGWREGGGSVAAPVRAFGPTDPNGVPVVADYDGDGTPDYAVFSSGDWWVRRSSDGVVVSETLRSGIYVREKAVPLRGYGR